MAQLWGGRFTKETDKLVYNFNASISYDQKFYRQDIRGSLESLNILFGSRERVQTVQYGEIDFGCGHELTPLRVNSAQTRETQ